MITIPRWHKLQKNFYLKPLLLFIVAAFAFTACDPMHTQFEEIEPAIMYEAIDKYDANTSARDLRVMSWNVKFAGGRIDFFFDCHGDRVHMTADEVYTHLDGLAAKINAYDPDILLLQEVDMDSKRVAHIDMVQYLLDHTHLNYGAYTSQWKADYVPSYGIGQVDTGSAIFSRWPLRNATRMALPLIEDQDALTQYFWLQRNLLSTEIATSKGLIAVVNIHTSAFSKDGTKKKQIDIFKKYLDDLEKNHMPFVAGGDLNTLPPGTVKTSGFEDSVCPKGDFDADDYGPEADWLAGLYDAYRSAIPLEQYQKDNTPYFSHTTDKNGFWNRKLDYLFTNGSFSNGMIHQDVSKGGFETMKLSDHAPLTAMLRWN